MLNVDVINKKIKEAVTAAQITDTDQLNDIVNDLFPTDSELKSTIEYVQSIKPFNTKTKEFVTEMVKSKVRDAMMQEAYTVYQKIKNKSNFTMEEVEEELNDYYEDDEYDI